MTVLMTLGFLGSFLLSSIINGMVLKTMWGWFMVTTFQLPVLSLPVAIGLAATVGLVVFQGDRKKAEEENWIQIWIEGVATSISHSLITLIVGYICKSYM